MKVLTVLGSPHREGHTATLLERYTGILQGKHRQAEIQNLWVGDGSIRPCMGCDACKNPTGPCVLDDAMREGLKAVLKAEVLILASPIYWFSVSSQLKSFIDRLYALDFSSFPPGKKLVMLSTFGDVDMERSGAVNVDAILRAMADFMNMDYVQHVGLNAQAASTEAFEVRV